MRPLIICTLICCFNSLTVSAQRYDFHVGLRLGCGISSNSNVQHILVSEEYYSNYTFRKRLQVIPAAELYFLYKPQEIYGALKLVSPITTERHAFDTTIRTN